MEQTKRQQQNSIDVENNETKSTGDFDRFVKIKSFSHFEDLSNEVIYEMFEFLDFCHLYDAFFDLNTRFQHLVSRSFLPIHINLSSVSKSAFERYHTNLIIPYQHRIKSLHLPNPFILDRIFSFNATPFVFTHLEKLTLTDFNTTRHRKFLIHLVSFPRLFSLTINITADIQNRYNFYRDIFSLPVLKYCKVSCKQCISYEARPVALTEFSPIEYLAIDHTVRLNEVYILLSYVPQLRRLSLHQLNRSSREQTNLSPIVLNRLTYVSLELESFSFNELESMIRNLFNQVQVLYVSAKNDIMYLDADRWKRLIVSSMPNLRIFDISISYSLRYQEDFLQFTTLIDQFNVLFWIERQWFFEHQISRDGHQNSIFFYTTNPYRKKYFILYGEKEGNIDTHNIDSVHHMNIRNEKAIITCGNYFPNVTELTISDERIIKNGHLIFTKLNSIIPLRQLTKLNMGSIGCSFSDIIQLLSCAPNIHTLDVNFDSYLSDLVLLQHDESFQLVSRTNNIIKLTVLSENTLGVIAFLVILFPRVQYLAITGFFDNLKWILPFLLSKTNPNTRRLSSLCMKCEIEMLKDFIESKKLLDDYSIFRKHHGYDTSMCLWW